MKNTESPDGGNLTTYRSISTIPDMKKKNTSEICNILMKIRTSKQAVGFLHDFLTGKEVASIVERWRIAKMIIKNIPHRKISKTLKVSISKVTRGSRAVQESRGGFKNFMTK